MLKYAAICPHPPILIPSIGQDYSREVEATLASLNELGNEIESLAIDTIVIISPHGPIQMDAMGINNTEKLKGDFSQFGSETSMEYGNDMDLGINIKKIANSKKIPVEMMDDGIPLDHGAMVPLYFLARKLPMKVVPISYSYLDYQKHFGFGEAIYEAIQNIDEGVALIASGDLSHRLTSNAPAGFSPKGKIFDKLLIEHLENDETTEILNMDSELIEEAGECGLRSIITLLGALSVIERKFVKMSYEGPFGVGYLVGKYKF